MSSFSERLNLLKKRIEEEKQLKAGNQEFSKFGKFVQLESITHTAERFDEENQKLKIKNKELRTEFKEQKKDRELLLKWLVMLKRENAKIKDEIETIDEIMDQHSNVDFLVEEEEKHEEVKVTAESLVMSEARSGSRRSTVQSPGRVTLNTPQEDP